MDISTLKPGDSQYQAYVGPPTQYDFMGATQFRLLCTLGIRATHSLLDVGCGSLRAGRLFISYLDKGNYFGIEPNGWLIHEAIKNQIGEDLIEIKLPTFDNNTQFDTQVFSQQFDFILAQSIFSHTGSDILTIALANFKKSLKADGLIAATFVEDIDDYPGTGWVYPECVTYRRSSIRRFATDLGLSVARIPWYHPRQTWYVFANNKNRLPDRTMRKYLSGAVLFDDDFVDSRQTRSQMRLLAGQYLKWVLARSARKAIMRSSQR